MQIEATQYGGDRTVVSATDGWDNPHRPYRRQCSEHGIHEPVAAPRNELAVEANDREWVPADDVAVSICRDCLIEEYRLANDADMAELLEAAREEIATQSNWSWRDEGFRKLYEPAYLEAAGHVSHCPFCGAELSSTSSTGEGVRCPEHGRLEVAARQLDEPTAPEA